MNNPIIVNPLMKVFDERANSFFRQWTFFSERRRQNFSAFKNFRWVPFTPLCICLRLPQRFDGEVWLVRPHTDPLIRPEIGSSEEEDGGSFLESEEALMLPISKVKHQGEDNNRKEDFKMCKGIFYQQYHYLLSLPKSP